MPNWTAPEFDWDDGNIDHLIDRHDVYPEEAEQVFGNNPYITITRVGVCFSCAKIVTDVFASSPHGT